MYDHEIRKGSILSAKEFVMLILHGTIAIYQKSHTGFSLAG
jgi:hypothetical protein